MISAHRLNDQPASVSLPIAAAPVLSTFVASNFFAVSAYKPALERTLGISPGQARMAAPTVFPFSFFRWKGWL